MILYHATPLYNDKSISRLGLLVSECDSRSKIKAIWLHTKGRQDWAAAHISMRHGMLVKNILFLEISIPKRFLTRYKRGIYYCKCDILPSCIRRAFRLEE